MVYLLHVKWFVPFKELIAGRGWEFSLMERPIQLGILLILVALAAAFLLEKKLDCPLWLKKIGKKYGKIILWVSNSLVGLFLLITAYDDVLFAPIFQVNNCFVKIVSAATVLAGILLIANFRVWFAGVLLTLAYFTAGFLYGFDEMLEHIHLLGIGIFVFLNDGLPFSSKSIEKFIEKWRPKSLEILRVLTGLALMILAWDEKLSHPILAEKFLETHQWNFMHDLLNISSFSNHDFALAAGVTEFLFGLVLVLGWVTRLNTLVMSIFFFITAVILGLHELVGHLPVFAVAILFLIWGKPKPGFKMSES